MRASRRFSIGTKYEYCPNGNWWSEISGVLDSNIYLFCDCKKCGGQVYELKPVKYNKNPEHLKAIIEAERKWQKLENTKDMLNYTNMDKVAELLTPSKEQL